MELRANLRHPRAAPFALSEEGLALETKLFGEMSEVWVKAAPEVAEILKA